MDSLCNYGSDEDQSQSHLKSSVNISADTHSEQDVNYEPVTMDMSEDSNEEEYYARKYGKYADVAAAARAQRFDPYEDDVSDAPTSPEPDPPTGSHERDPALAVPTQSEARDPSSNGAARQNTTRHESGRTQSEHARRNSDRGGEEAVQPKPLHGYGSYYERAKRKLSGGEDEEEYDESGSFGNASSYPPGNSNFPPSQHRAKDRAHGAEPDTRRSQHDERKSARYERDRSRERSADKDRKGSESRDRDRRERDRKSDKKRRRSSRSRSRDRKHDRKSSRRHRSRSRSRSSRSRSRSSSRHHGNSRHSKDRRRSSDRDRRSSDRDRDRHHGSSRRDRDRREPSMGELPRPYAPYERKPNKLQILEKLGIELKVPDQPPAPGQPPQVIAVSKATPTSTIPPLMSTPITLGGLVPGGTPVGPSVTPQDLLQKTIAAQVEKIKADTGIELPKYYNPMAINPTKYAEQIQKRRLLWGNKQSSTTSAASSSTPSHVSTSTSTSSSQTATCMPADSTAGGGGSKPPGTIWQGATFSGDQDGRLTNKFQRLMGMKNAGVTVSSTTPAGGDAASDRNVATAASSAAAPDLIKKQEEMFHSMESQYEAARLATHTHRGLGLGFGTFAPR